MELALRFTNHADEEICTANYPEIQVPSAQGRPAYRRAQQIRGKWQAITPETAASVSAVSLQ